MNISFALLSIFLLANGVTPAKVRGLSKESRHNEHQDPPAIIPSSLSDRIRSSINYVMGLGPQVVPKSKAILSVFDENKDELRKRFYNLQDVVIDLIMRSGMKLKDKSADLAKVLMKLGNELKEVIFETTFVRR